MSDARKLLLATPIPVAEMALRIVEAYHGMRRPKGKTAEQCLNDLDGEDRQRAIRAASAAVGFFAECVKSNQGTVQ